MLQTRTLTQAQEKYDQPEEERNEAGDPMEPFHLRKEMEVITYEVAGQKKGADGERALCGAYH